MYKTDTIETGITASQEHDAISRNELGESWLGIGIIMTMSALIGVWGVTCLISGLQHTASIQQLGSTLFTALTGI